MTDLLKKESGDSNSVVCLGRQHANERARREYYLSRLAEKLKDPAFRSLEGFPNSTDDAILAMSDPPYYTACPNPFIKDFVEAHGSPYDPSEKRTREPLAVDVSVGKTDAVYKAHSYHTKVPHLAIVPSILHYTNPGDIVLDGFSGSGMTGVAAQWCGAAPAAYRHELETEWKKQGKKPPVWGARRAILNDLSPAATFISATYNLRFDLEEFVEAGNAIIKSVENEFRWMYETLHSDGKTKGLIEDTIWSEVFTCPQCAGEVVFLDEAFNADTQEVRESFPCPHCGSELNKRGLEKFNETRVDKVTGKSFTSPKRRPSFITYKVAGKPYVKKPDADDLALLDKIEALPIPAGFPSSRMMHADERVGCWGDKWRAGTASFTHVHHLYFARTTHILSALVKKARSAKNRSISNALMFMLDSHFVNLSIQNRYRPGVSFPYNPLSGVYYISSLICEASPFTAYSNKLKRISAAFRTYRPTEGAAVVNTGSATDLRFIPNASIDYVFTDPPFGDNLAYAELNFQVEAFYGVFTKIEQEAIVSNFQGKQLTEYKSLMRRSFEEYFRVLKPGRWMTVVFSNTKASVWNGIQTALQEAGFVIADVSSLDKQQGSFNAVTNATSVKQDLVISAYKPNGGLEDRFKKACGNTESIWDFVRTHLEYLAPSKLKAGVLEFVKERDPRIVFDRMVAWFVRHGFPVPLSSQEFQSGLAQRFEMRDGMVFLQSQAADYDKKRSQVASAPQMELFVSDERSAIDWLTDFLKVRPSTYQEIHPEFITQLGAGWKRHEAKPELSSLLESNFILYDGASDVPSQIHGYLSTNYKDLRGLDKANQQLVAKAKDRWYVPDPNKAQDLEKKRERALLKEFEGYQAASGRKLKEFRLEVLRAGFKAAWGAKNYKAIIAIAQKIPEEALQEDEKLLLWYDQALTRSEAGA